MHIIFQKVGSSGTNNLAVIGVMLQASEAVPTDLEDPQAKDKKVQFLDSLVCTDGDTEGSKTKVLPKGNEKCVVCGDGKSGDCSIDLTKIYKQELSGPYYHYQGSL